MEGGRIGHVVISCREMCRESRCSYIYVDLQRILDVSHSSPNLDYDHSFSSRQKQYANKQPPSYNPNS